MFDESISLGRWFCM